MGQVELLGHAGRKIALVIMIVAHPTTVPPMPRSGLPKQPSRGYRLGVRRSLPPVPLTVAFVNCINHGDLPGLVSLMSDDHRLQVFDETPVTGRDDNERAWSGYFEAFPSYLIHPHHIAETPDGAVAVLGHTTGSHLGLADGQESLLTVIWIARCQQDSVSSWTLAENTAPNRDRYGLGAQQK
jgi:ketosteroid isomerase-like protein